MGTSACRGRAASFGLWRLREQRALELELQDELRETDAPLQVLILQYESVRRGHHGDQEVEEDDDGEEEVLCVGERSVEERNAEGFAAASAAKICGVGARSCVVAGREKSDAPIASVPASGISSSVSTRDSKRKPATNLGNLLHSSQSFELVGSNRFSYYRGVLKFFVYQKIC